MSKEWCLIAGVFIAFTVVEMCKKYYGDMDFEYDENWIGDLTTLREDSNEKTH